MKSEALSSETRLGRVRTPAGGFRFPDEVYHPMVIARLMKRVQVDANGCWLHHGFLNYSGYSLTNYRGYPMNAHRAMYLSHHNVRLEREQYVLHRCDVRNCINPEHLFVGTAKDNNIDCAQKLRHYEATRTHCPKDHPYDEQNTYWVKTNKPGGWSRLCKECTRTRNRERWKTMTPEKRAQLQELRRTRRARPEAA